MGILIAVVTYQSILNYYQQHSLVKIPKEGKRTSFFRMGKLTESKLNVYRQKQSE